MGTATFAVTKVGVAGNMRIVIGTITMSASYAANGDTLSNSALGFSEVFFGTIEGQANRIILQYDRANAKVLAFYPTGGATTAPSTAAGAIDPITTTGASTASAVDATTPALTPGRMKQVAATADLSTITAPAIFHGA